MEVSSDSEPQLKLFTHKFVVHPDNPKSRYRENRHS